MLGREKESMSLRSIDFQKQRKKSQQEHLLLHKKESRQEQLLLQNKEWLEKNLVLQSKQEKPIHGIPSLDKKVKSLESQDLRTSTEAGGKETGLQQRGWWDGWGGRPSRRKQNSSGWRGKPSTSREQSIGCTARRSTLRRTWCPGIFQLEASDVNTNHTGPEARRRAAYGYGGDVCPNWDVKGNCLCSSDRWQFWNYGSSQYPYWPDWDRQGLQTPVL